MKFSPGGTLNISQDASELQDGDFVRCKNLRIDQPGKAKTRDGCTKINSTAINTSLWHIEEQAGVRVTFAGDAIYSDETSIASGLTEAQWSAMHYNAFNDTTKNIFAINGTDRKRIEGGVVYEWGLTAPTVAPTLRAGTSKGLTGRYNAKYTYVRKVGNAIVAESNPSPAADNPVNLADQSLAVDFTESTDSQVTHIRLYRTLSGGSIYYFDLELSASNTYAYGYTWAWEKTGAYISGTGHKFTHTDATHSTENTEAWEELFKDREDVDSPDVPQYGDPDLEPFPWWWFDDEFDDEEQYNIP